MKNKYQSLNHYENSNDFSEKVSILIKNQGKEALSLISLDFDNFNYINDLFGFEAGDRVLSIITEHFDHFLHDGDLFTRINADHFSLLFNESNVYTIITRLQAMTELNECLTDILPEHYRLICSGGIVLIKDFSESLSSLLDKTNYARKCAKGNYVNTFELFSRENDEDIKWKKVITMMMESALQNNELEMYLQPKVLIKTEEVVGAEALVRWNSNQFGMIYPDRFIPVLEQNGFILRLDFFMLEQACKFISACTEQAYPLLPLSVNFSKLHIRNSNFVSNVFHIVSKYKISPNLIEIEFTENVFSDDYDHLVEVFSSLKYLGFRVSLDDFGNAYSSLNYLKDLPLDIIKIDKRFLSSSTNTEKGRIIVTKIVELIKSLRLVSVMEGIETNEQADFLQKLNCDLGQGYYYSKPLPVQEFIQIIKCKKLLSNSDSIVSLPTLATQFDLNEIPQEFQMDNWELYNLGQNIDMGLMKGYLDEEATIQYVNKRALEYLGYTRQEFREIFHNSIAAFTHPDDVKTVQENIEAMVKNGNSIEFQTRALRKDGKVIVLKGRSSYVIDSSGRPIGIYAFQDVTQELEQTEALQNELKDKIHELERRIHSEQESREALRISEELYRLIVEQSNDMTFDWNFKENTLQFSNNIAQLIGELHLSNQISILAFKAYLHPDDLLLFEEWVKSTTKHAAKTKAEFRMLSTNKSYIWVRCSSTTICDQHGIPVRAVGMLCNIDWEKTEMQELTLKSQLDPLTSLFNKLETQNRIKAALIKQADNTFAFFIIDIDNFKGVNDTLGHQLGDTVLVEVSQKLKHLFQNSDIVGRIGGDEFVVFAGYNSEEMLVQKCNQLVSEIHRTYFGTTMQYAITISAGIACYPMDGKTFEDLYQLADTALYESKNNGKNRFTIYNNHMEQSEQELRTPLEWQERFLSSYFSDDFTYNVFEMLYETKDMVVTIQKILELTGRRFDIDRAYIFQHSQDMQYTKNTYEWCSSGIPPEIDSLQYLSIENLTPYMKAYNKEGLLCCNDLSLMDEYTQKELARQGVLAFLHCAIYDSGKMTGFIGFDICRKRREWQGDEIAVLGYLSRILSVYLQKNKASSDLITSHQNYVSMLDNLNGYVYVIDTTNFELLYVNNASRQCGFEVGDFCYHASFSRDTPCEVCPVKQLSPDKPFASEEIDSLVLNAWVNASASILHWSDRKNAALICCMDISKYKK